MTTRFLIHPGGAATKVNEVRPVDADTLAIAQRAGKRARNRTAQIRRDFVQRARPDAPDPPLARFIGGRAGRGGEVRLKVYLTQLWIAAGGSHDVNFAPSAYARLLGLDDPYKKGARKVNDALDWLHAEGFITLERSRGLEPVATLLREDGSRTPYELPGRAAKDPSTGKVGPEHFYFRVPPSFWTQTWVAHLSGPAVAVLLVLLARSRSKRQDGIWISPSQLTDWYAFSDDTRRRGLAMLEDSGLVFVGRQAVDPDFGFRRVRNTYSIEPALLDLPMEAGAVARYTALAELLGQPKSEAWSDYVHARIASDAPPAS